MGLMLTEFSFAMNTVLPDTFTVRCCKMGLVLAENELTMGAGFRFAFAVRCCKMGLVLTVFRSAM